MSRRFQWLPRRLAREGLLLASIILVAGGTWAFIALADEVSEPGTPAIDERVLSWIFASGRPAGPSWLPQAARDLTSLGSAAVLTLFTVAVAGYLLLRRARVALYLELTATVGGAVASTALKLFFARPRPSIAHPLVVYHTYSFPSGHAMLSAVVYLTLGALAARLLPGWPTKLYVMSVALLLTLIVGVTRVYLGAHYPTDVLAGWTAGGLWALLAWGAAVLLQRRGAMRDS